MEELKCEACNRSFDTKESLSQHNAIKHSTPSKGEKKISNKYLIISGLILAVLIFSYTLYARSQQPGYYDDFAKCLAEKNAVVYGNDFCSYTTRQLNLFGNSKKYLKYIKCADNAELCDSEGIKITPTWNINGKKYEGGQTFDKLSELTGCK